MIVAPIELFEVIIDEQKMYEAEKNPLLSFLNAANWVLFLMC